MASASDRVAGPIARALLRQLRAGHLVVAGPEDAAHREYGDPSADLRTTITVRKPGFHRALLRGSNGLAESYADGVWECDDMVVLIRMAARNMRSIDRVRRVIHPLTSLVQRINGIRRRPTRRRSRRQIAAHYDLGNDLFELFLDESLTYSAAIFESPEATLEEAQQAKLHAICRKLGLGPDDHLVEIGSGWGALAMLAAGEYGARVTTTTISQEQHRVVNERVAAAGLEDRVTVLLSDYRDLEGRYDKLVSVEMIEAVGWQYFDTFFAKCSDLLRPGGAMLLQAITIEDDAYEVEKVSKSFINTHIFPGGCLPSLEIIARARAKAGGLVEIGREDLTRHYAVTLERWRSRFEAAADRAHELGYDQRFRRLWSFYLSYCEAGFREERIGDFQLLMAKPGPAELPAAGRAATVTG
ncbi:MAG: cyclopropane-fatty-acyl-phospholipid synthase [Thermoleophilaceae bacterium]|jgi:cyclopropane-fatty-acyl-phospholipid synthase|nr:cyclopropane-fatty-acyl-phospholipid synthase [Thermoleophilaceae bacterium]